MVGNAVIKQRPVKTGESVISTSPTPMSRSFDLENKKILYLAFYIIVQPKFCKVQIKFQLIRCNLISYGSLACGAAYVFSGSRYLQLWRAVINFIFFGGSVCLNQPLQLLFTPLNPYFLFSYFDKIHTLQVNT